MKKLYSLIAAILVTSATLAQGTIVAFTIDPPAPTTASNVKVYVDLMFTSMGCNVDNQGHSTAGSNTTAYAHHCIGMLTAICNTVDTFNLGMLPAGSHLFDLTLTSGSGGPPCTPGVVPDDQRNTTFTVTAATGLGQSTVSKAFFIFPNPSNGNFTISCPDKNAEIKVYNILGEIIYTQELKSDKSEINISNQAKGIYFYQIMNDDKVVGNGKLVVE